MIPPELFTRNNKKKGQCIRHNLTQKYANRDIIAAIALRLNQELDITGLPIFILYDSFRNFY